MKNIKLIATDLDDTLMRPDKSISDYSAEVFDRCRRRGILLCLVTARSLKASARAIRLLSPDYTVTCGGALCLRGDKILSQTPLNKNDANSIIGFCAKLPSVQYFQTETVEGRYYVSGEVSPNATGDYSHAEHYDFTKPLSCDVYKLVIRIADESDRRALAESFPAARIYNYTGGATCFIASREAAKLGGLEIVAEDMGIGLESAAAFGDDTGDADYLSACGYGVAVDNAVYAAKQVSRYVCGPNWDDGVAKWLEKNILTEFHR